MKPPLVSFCSHTVYSGSLTLNVYVDNAQENDAGWAEALKYRAFKVNNYKFIYIYILYKFIYIYIYIFIYIYILIIITEK